MKKNSIHLPELLAPAGSFAHLKAAVTAGADAIYIGGRRFGARAYAENASKEEMVDALHYAHFYDRKVYLTVNTLMKEEELEYDLEAFLAPFYQAGLDGVIVQDPGAAWKIGKCFPDLPLHGSTQMTVTDPCGAIGAKRLGMCRVVPARELSLAEIISIKECGIEVEVFVHGALCYSYSGQCLMSSNYGGRSGNRGQCAQPCRLPCQLMDSRGKSLLSGEKSPEDIREGRGYAKRGPHLLSPKDLCALPILPSLVEAGVDSLKIEGRMKNVEYVAGVTAIYRKYLDRLRDFQTPNSDWDPDSYDMEILAELYQREGFTKGYFYQHNGPDMMATREPKNTGRKIGEIYSIRKNRVTIALSGKSESFSRLGTDKGDGGKWILSPGDILIIPLTGDAKNQSGGKNVRSGIQKGQDSPELVLTVPSDLEACCFQRQGRSFITLNAPGAGRLEKGMPVYRRFHQALNREIHRKYVEHELKLPVHACFQARIGQPSILSLSCCGEEVSLEGPLAQAPLQRPLVEEDVRKQLARTGEEAFCLDGLQVEMEEEVFLPLSGLKDLRRRAYQALGRKMEMRYDRDKYIPGSAKSEPIPDLPFKQEKEERRRGKESDGEERNTGANPGRLVTVYNKEILLYILEQDFAQTISLPAEFFTDRQLEALAGLCREAGVRTRLCLPRVFREWKEGDSFKIDRDERNFDLAGRHGRERNLLLSGLFDEVEVHNINQAQFIHDLYRSDDYLQSEYIKIPVIAGMSFYQWNRTAIHAVETLFPEIGARVLPAELSPEEWEAIGEPGRQRIECLVYGRYPLMISAQCLNKTTGRCSHQNEILTLCRDRKIRMPVSTHCRSCYNLIWRDRPVDRIREMRDCPIPVSRYLFDTFGNSPKEVKAMIRKTGAGND